MSKKSSLQLYIKKIQKTAAKVPSFVGGLFTNLGAFLQIKIKNIYHSLINIPAWIRSRPQAVRDWRARDRKKKKYRSFRLQKRIKPEPRYVPSARIIFIESLKFIYKYKKVFLFIVLIHTLLYIAFVRSPASFDIATLQDSINELIGSSSGWQSNFATLGAVIGADSSSQTGTGLSTALLLGVSLVYIWAIRKLSAGKHIKARDAYYNGLQSIIPSLIVLIVASIQLLPFAALGFVYATARTGGLFISGFEDMAVFTVTALVGLLTLYWITSTVVAFYISTLPGMYPGAALGAAKKLVAFRRATVFRRIIIFPIIAGLAYGALLLLLIRFAPPSVLLVSEILQLIVVPIVHVYMYKLYRSLI